MKTQLSNQASMVNAHIATRILDEAGFKEQVNGLLSKDFVTAQMELSAYIRANFQNIADVEGVAAELVTAWLNTCDGEVAVKATELVRRSRSTFAIGLVGFTLGALGIGLLVSSALDSVLQTIIFNLI